MAVVLPGLQASDYRRLLAGREVGKSLRQPILRKDSGGNIRAGRKATTLARTWQCVAAIAVPTRCKVRLAQFELAADRVYPADLSVNTRQPPVGAIRADIQEYHRPEDDPVVARLGNLQRFRHVKIEFDNDDVAGSDHE